MNFAFRNSMFQHSFGQVRPPRLPPTSSCVVSCIHLGIAVLFFLLLSFLFDLTDISLHFVVPIFSSCAAALLTDLFFIALHIRRIVLNSLGLSCGSLLGAIFMASRVASVTAFDWTVSTASRTTIYTWLIYDCGFLSLPLHANAPPILVSPVCVVNDAAVLVHC